MKHLMSLVLASAFLMTITTGCAAGSATAGYALKAQSADTLTPCGEQRIVERTKKEMRDELMMQGVLRS